MDAPAFRSTLVSLGLLCWIPAKALEQQVLRPVDQVATPIAARTFSRAGDEQGILVAQAEIRIPSDADLERMEQRAITTPPLDTGEARGRPDGEEAEIRRMDERARRIDERLMGGGAICSDCK